MRCTISRSVLDGIRHAAAAAAPDEACGLLFGSVDQVEAWQVTENVAQNPGTRFEIDPGALFAALRAERTGGPQLIGYWHSHPSGSTNPSATDAGMADPDGKLWLICAGEAAALWRASPTGALLGRFDPIKIDES